MSVPTDAVIYLENQRMTMTGAKRRFYSPPLKSGKDYFYNVKVEIKRGDRVVSATSKVKVRAQRDVQLTFTEQGAGELVSSVAPLGRKQL